MKLALEREPYTSAAELRHHLEERFDIKVSTQLVALVLRKKLRYSWKRTRKRGPRGGWTDEKIAAFKRQFLQAYNDGCLSSWDESSFDQRCRPVYGYAAIGKQAIVNVPHRSTTTMSWNTYSRTDYFFDYARRSVQWDTVRTFRAIFRAIFDQITRAWCLASPRSACNMPMCVFAPMTLWRLLGGPRPRVPLSAGRLTIWSDTCRELGWRPGDHALMPHAAAKIQAAFRGWTWRKRVLWNPNTRVGALALASSARRHLAEVPR